MPRKRPTRRLAPVVLLVVVALVAGGVYLVVRHVPAILGRTGCTAGSGHAAVALDPQQAQIAATIAGVAYHRGMPSRAVTVAYATAMQETHLHDPDYGDRDSVGVFQQRPSEGWGPPTKLINPVYASTRFFQALAQVHGYQKMPVYKAAQAVQHSADGSAYQQYAASGAALAAYFTTKAHAVTCWYDPPTQAASQGVPTALNLDGAVKSLTQAFGAPGGGGGLSRVSRTRSHGDESLYATASRNGWAVANWLVTNASSYGITRVRYAGYQWTAGLTETSWQAGPGGAAGGIVAS